jgi:hypothetical protein
MTADTSSRSRGAIAPEFVAWRFVLSLRYLSSQLDRSKNNPQDLPMTIPFKTIRARAEKRKGGPKALAKLLPPKPDLKALARLADDRILAEMSKAGVLGRIRLERDREQMERIRAGVSRLQARAADAAAG